MDKKVQDILKDIPDPNEVIKHKKGYTNINVDGDGRVTVNKIPINKSSTNKFTINKSPIIKSPINKSVKTREAIKDIFRELSKPKFHPAWMDYCDPYHCNDYHKRACGLNRANMKFQWFQSACHIIMNNMCYTYRGFLKYDVIEPKFCEKFVPKLRTGCPDACDNLLSPVCTQSKIDHHIVIFKNQCYMDKANCRVEGFLEYIEVDFSLCTDYVRIGQFNYLKL